MMNSNHIFSARPRCAADPDSSQHQQQTTNRPACPPLELPRDRYAHRYLNHRRRLFSPFLVVCWRAPATSARKQTGGSGAPWPHLCVSSPPDSLRATAGSAGAGHDAARRKRMPIGRRSAGVVQHQVRAPARARAGPSLGAGQSAPPLGARRRFGRCRLQTELALTLPLRCAKTITFANRRIHVASTSSDRFMDYINKNYQK